MHKTILDYVDQRGRLVRIIYFEESTGKAGKNGKMLYTYDIAVFEGMKKAQSYRLETPLSEGKAIILGERLFEDREQRNDAVHLADNLEMILKEMILIERT